MQKIRIPITIELSDKTLNTIGEIVEGNAPLAHKLETYTNELVHQMAGGAVILDSDAMDRIRDAGDDMETADDIVAACQSVRGFDSGEYVIRFPKDPALTANMQERAATNGITVQQLIRDIVSMCISNGWFFDLNSNAKTVFFSYPEAHAVDEILETTDFNAGEVIEGLRRAMEIINENADRAERADAATQINSGIVPGSAQVSPIPESQPVVENVQRLDKPKPKERVTKASRKAEIAAKLTDIHAGKKPEEAVTEPAKEEEEEGVDIFA